MESHGRFPRVLNVLPREKIGAFNILPREYIEYSRDLPRAPFTMIPPQIFNAPVYYRETPKQTNKPFFQWDPREKRGECL